MSSTSSTAVARSPPHGATKYDVFLSFRGEDTRNNITGHIYEALKRAALATFRDNNEIRKGLELEPEIVSAIKASETSVIVISENFATSTFCLEELSLILDQRRDCNHYVLPAFFKVDPSDVRKQTGSFKIEVKDNSKWTRDNVNKWKIALTMVSNLIGVTLEKSETDFVNDIVDTIFDKVTSKKFHLPLNLVRIDARYKDIDFWVKQSDPKLLVIWGMGGSGKTTLARYIVYSNRDKFENISIIEHIASKWKEPRHLLELQEKLLGGVLGGKKRKIPNESQGTSMIEQALETTKSLIFLDDIVNHDQLLRLIGTGKINKESKIIVTTRETKIAEWFGSRYGKCCEYEMRLLDSGESLELLSLHAFGSKDPLEEYKELAQEVVVYCEGNPLALEVLGSSLSQDINILSWKSALAKIKSNFHSGIHSVLKTSYDSLPHNREKDLFLHIACFFNGADMDSVVKIFEHDCFAVSSLQTLTKRCLLSISSNQTLLMHPLLQEMGRFIVDGESPKDPAERSRVWRNRESYDLLSNGTGSKKVEGLALDKQMLAGENMAFEELDLNTDAFKNMYKLKLLYLKSVQLSGSYTNFSKDLLWLCWIGFDLKTVPSGLSMRNLVALDMSNSCLEVFEISTALHSLKILNLKDSEYLLEIRNIDMMPNLETLILWNCRKLVYVCETIGHLKSLVLLDMTGCENLYTTSISDRGSTQKYSFPMPSSLERLFLKDCKLEYTDFFPLDFGDQSSMQYLNLGNNHFRTLPNCNHLKNLLVLDLSLCSRLECLLCLPSKLEKLYINQCESLERVTFESHRFTLQELVCEGCTNLSEIEGFIKLVPVTKLNERHLGHMKWLKEYQYHEVRLVGGDEIAKNRSQCVVQVLYEFGIMSTSLPEIKIPKVMPEPKSEKTSKSVSFKVPECPNNMKLKGINVTFKYKMFGDDCIWFVKMSTTNGVNFIYNPRVFGRPGFREVGSWLSYWPIGNMLYVRDNVNVSIIVVRGLEVWDCDARLVYTDDEVADETLESNMGWVETLDGDLSAFQLSKGAYYLCRRDFFDKLEVDTPIPVWFRDLVGGNIDHAEVRGWGRTGRLQQSSSSYTVLKTLRCIIRGPDQSEENKIVEMSKSSFVDTSGESISSIGTDDKQSGTKSDFSNVATKVLDMTSEDREVKENLEALNEKTQSVTSESIQSTMQEIKSPVGFPGLKATSYDIFLSFRSEDTRSSFTSHLYVALERAGIRTFKDEYVFRGQNLDPEIRRAIQESRGSIILLSKNYPTSSWCLDELLLILKQRKEGNHFVLPVFYGVDPAEVRKQKKTFNLKVDNTSTRWTPYNVSRWKEALKNVADLSGLVLSGSEIELLDDVLDIVHTKLNLRQVSLPPNLIAMDVPDQEIKSWLEKSDADVLAICGMGGSGKTTLARYIVYSNMHYFDNICILEDIGSRCKEPRDLLQLQEKLFRDISGGRKRKIQTVHHGVLKLSEVLQTEKALIVLDDIVEGDQLVALLGTGNINEQSKIILTTRDSSISRWLRSRSWRCQEYKMKLLNDGDSLELFSLHAFQSRVPKEGYEDLAVKVVQYCEGNPLALADLGSFLYRTRMEEWASVLCGMENEMEYTIYQVFKRSYNSLPYDFQKELFLHIACFFTGEDMDYVVKIFEHDFAVLSGVNTLIDKHLISISPDKKLMMHRLHQEMGRAIVDQESNKPTERSRVWRNKESYQVLREGKGSQSMQGVALDMKEFSYQSSKLTTDALGNMDNLKLLQLKFVQLYGSYENFPKDLRWLCWHGFHIRTIPSDLYLGNTVVIDMSYSKLEVFEPPMLLKSLRILNLKDSHNLLEVRNISLFPNLENLNLSCCGVLVHICETLKDLSYLKVLNMTKCEKLFKGEQNQRHTKQPLFSFPNSLEILILKDCNFEVTDYFSLSFSDQSFLQNLDLSNNLFKLLPSYSHLKQLRVLDLSFCPRLECLLSLPSTLEELYINNCEKLETVTFKSCRFTLQKFQCEGCINLCEIEGIIKMQPISKLDGSYLGHMKWLKEYQDHEVCLVDGNDLSITRSCCVQMLHEFDIMSTSLPDTKDPNMAQYISESSSVWFDVPAYPKNRRLKGLNVTFKYRISGDDSVWFAKIKTNGVDLFYNPTVFGKPGLGKAGIWFSYWPIGNKLATGDNVKVSIIAMSGLEVIECGASLVYTYDVANETLENTTGWVETLGGDLSRFQLSTGAYYLCRRNLFELAEVGRLTPHWLEMLVGDSVDKAEVQGWKISGRPMQTTT